MTERVSVEKLFVAQRVATKLFATANAVDLALAEPSVLMADMLKARKDIDLPAVAGAAAAAPVVAAIAALGAARSAMVAAHGELNEAKLRIGVRTKLAGYEDKPGLSHDQERATMRVAS